MDGFEHIERAIADIAAGKAVVVVDDEDRENEGDLVFAAQHATPELVSFMVRYTSGYICVPLTGEACDRLDLPPAHSINQDRHGTAYTVSPATYPRRPASQSEAESTSATAQMMKPRMICTVHAVLRKIGSVPRRLCTMF